MLSYCIDTYIIINIVQGCTVIHLIFKYSKLSIFEKLGLIDDKKIK